MVELQEPVRFPGTFIVFEGGEGTGKSTQVATLVEHLRRIGHEVVATREPGGSAISEQIRGLILRDSSVGMSPRCEALLFAAARAEHAASLIRPALERGAVVVSDRFVDSSIAYQGAARDLGRDDIAKISSWATGGVVADLTIVLDLDPVFGLARAQDPNRLEAEDLAFHLSVQETFLMLARANPGGHVVVSGDQTPDQVATEVWRAVQGVLGDAASTITNVPPPLGYSEPALDGVAATSEKGPLRDGPMVPGPSTSRAPSPRPSEPSGSGADPEPGAEPGLGSR